MILQPNITFDNHYTLIRQLGQGGFSEVWLAHDSYMDLDVAIKIYAPGQCMDPNSIDEFRREITGVFQLNHPNLLCPKHLGIWEKMPYLIMAYCPAGSCVKCVGNMTEEEIWHLIRDVAAGLAYLHEKDIVHQDIKPDNILLDIEGNYLITDFGISTRARSTLRKSVMSTTNSAGTLAYMGPERFSTQPAPTKASDIWSLGAMLYELLEGVTPFPPDFGGSMLNAGAAIPTINAPVSENLKQTIYKMLSKETWDRPTAATLVEWAKNPSAVEKPSRPTQRKITKPAEQPQQPKQPKSRGWIWIIVTLLLITGLGTVGIRKYQEHQLEIAINEQIRYYNSIREAQRQDSIRQIQIQDSLREVRHQDSIRVEQERIRQDSIEREKKRLERGVHNGHPYIDLGLSVKWATYNIGAKKPEDCGNYYAWGETKTKNYYNWATYKYSETTDEFYYNKITKYTMSSYHNVPPDKKAVLSISDDAAHVVWKGNWRMPTYAELQELRKNCHWKWTTINGVNGYKATSKINGNSIFFPAAGSAPHSSRNQSNTPESVGVQGFYWSKSLRRDYDLGAWNLWFTTKEVSTHGLSITAFRCRGYSIRPVCP